MGVSDQMQFVEWMFKQGFSIEQAEEVWEDLLEYDCAERDGKLEEILMDFPMDR